MNIKIKTAQLYTYEKRSFRSAGISVLSVKGIILKKINISFIVHFYLGTYIYNLDIL